MNSPYRFNHGYQRPVVAKNYIQNNNIAQNVYKAKKHVNTVHKALDFVIGTYVALLCDIACEGIEEMYDYWKGTQFFASNKVFAEKLTLCYKQSQDRYDEFCKLIADKKFFSDLLDAGQEYIQPTTFAMFENLKDIFKNQVGCKRYVAVAQAVSNFTLVSAVGYRVSDLMLEAKESGVEIKNAEIYSMQSETKLLADIIEMLLEKNKLNFDIKDAVAGIAQNLQPSYILKHAGREAMRLNPAHAEEFKHQVCTLFEGFSWDD